MIPPRTHHAVTLAFALMVIWMSDMCTAQPKGFNYDEDKVPQFSLPDPLTMEDGRSVTTSDQWRNQRRPELLRLFQKQVYGRLPAGAKQARVQVEITEQSDKGPHGTRRIQFTVMPLKDGRPVSRIAVLAYLPQTDEPVPVFLGLNFRGNHSIHPDPEIALNENWQRPGEGIVDNRATADTRGTSASRWAVAEITGRGYGVLSAYYGDVDPDFDDFTNGPHPAYYDNGQTQPAADEWGSIAAWAWGLSRILDALAQHEELAKWIDAERVAVLGHSRLGKTSLWAGASDERFALVISNDSGCGGAALSRRAFGETLKRINTSFPHWFCDNFTQYNDNENALPIDQHALIALIAPRPVYVASAEGDRWADPRGEYLSAFHADPVYKLLGTDGLIPAGPNPPPVDHAANAGMIGYHIRSGKHDVTGYDWQQYLTFADRHLKD